MTKSGMARIGAGLLLLSLTACTHWPGDLERIVNSSNRDFSRLPDAGWVEIDLQDLIDHPTSYKLMYVRFYAILNNQHEQVYVPGYLMQKEENTKNFSVWPTTALLWNEADYTRSLPTMYLHRDHPDQQLLMDTPRYSLVMIRGIVENDYENIPFVHVMYYNVISPAVYDDASLASMAKGLSKADQPAEAIGHLETALKGTLSGVGRLYTHLRLARHYEARGDFQNALLHFEDALGYDSENAEALEGADRCYTQLERIAAIEAGIDPDPEP